MSNALVIPKNFGAVSTVFTAQPFSTELGEGISAGFAVMGYRGKVWTIKHGGEETPLMRSDGDGPRGSIEVVIIRASPVISKIFYKDGYVDGSNAAPDCWSNNGITPDAAAPQKQCSTCAACPMNAWGSRTTEAGKQAKACADAKRLAVIPLDDLDNTALGGPMLLRVPAASLKDTKKYSDVMQSYGFPFYGVGTRIGFDPAEAFPKFAYNAIRPLTDDEAQKIMDLRDDPRVTAILSEGIENTVMGTGQAAAPASPFEQPAAPDDAAVAAAKAEAAAAEAKAKEAAVAKAKAAAAAKAKAAAAAKAKADADAKAKAEADAAKAAAPKPDTSKADAAKAAAAKAKAAAAAAAAAAALAAAEAEAAEAEAAAAAGEATTEEAPAPLNGEVMDPVTGEISAGASDFDALLDNMMADGINAA